MTLGELPEGRRGRLLAVALLVLAAAALWAGVVAPLVDWFDRRAEQVERQGVLAAHMERIAAELPALRAGALRSVGTTPVSVIEGGSDAVAAATLQGRLQQWATAANASVTSTEVLAAEPVGRFRRIGVRIAINARWPAIVRFLGEIDADPTRLLVNDLQLQSMRANPTDADPTINASMVVFGFRAADPAAP